MSKKILIITGEASGDLYGALLVSALKQKYPESEFIGVGGLKMQQEGVKIIYPIDKLAIIGVSEVFSKLKDIKNLYNLLRRKLDENIFDLAILVNYPGFNLRFAKVLKSKNIPVIFYSSPQVWAWGKWRLKHIKKFVDKMIVFFKFEEEFYKKNGINAEFIGHPLVDIVGYDKYETNIKKDPHYKTIALVPGSREREIKKLFPILLKSAKILNSKLKDVRFIVTKHPQLPYNLYKKELNKYDLPIRVIDGRIHECLNKSDIAITASGSVTLEAVLLGVPMVIIYKVSLLTSILFLIFARLSYVGLVNIIAGYEIAPEFLQYRATPKNIAKETLNILLNSQRYEKIKEDLKNLANTLGSPGASRRGAETISKFLSN